MTRLLQGRVAIVTGAGGGLGRSHALELARHGARVVVNDLPGERHGASAAAVVEEIHRQGGEAIALTGDVTRADEMEAMAAHAVATWGRIDILVNNAGILRDRTFAKMTLEDFRLVLDVHVMGAVHCTKAVWARMQEQQYGRIVMTTSSSGLYGNFGQSNYGAAKMALVGLMQTLAIEGAKSNIRVNSLAPTAATQMTEGVLSDESLRLLDPALVSPGLLALVSEDAPTRAILCAGAGNFAAAHVTLTDGYRAGEGPDAGEKVAAHWTTVSARSGEIVPAYGFTQAERELAKAGFSDKPTVMGA